MSAVLNYKTRHLSPLVQSLLQRATDEWDKIEHRWVLADACEEEGLSWRDVSDKATSGLDIYFLTSFAHPFGYDYCAFHFGRVWRDARGDYVSECWSLQSWFSRVVRFPTEEEACRFAVFGR